MNICYKSFGDLKVFEVVYSKRKDAVCVSLLCVLRYFTGLYGLFDIPIQSAQLRS